MPSVCGCRGQGQRADYLSGSICKSGLSVHNSHRLKAQCYLHATYTGGSICVSVLLVQEDTHCSTELLILVEVSVKVVCKAQSYLHATYSGGNICVQFQEDTDCSTELLILVEVSVKVTCRSTTATD